MLDVPAAGWAGVQGHQAACAAAQLAARAGPGAQAPAACGHSAGVPAQVSVATNVSSTAARYAASCRAMVMRCF